MAVLKRTHKTDVLAIDEPRVGFVSPVGPPVWWQEAFKIAVVIFIVVIALTFIREHIRSLESERSSLQIEKTNINTLQPTAPYRPDAILTDTPFVSVSIVASDDGVQTEPERTSLSVGDIVYLHNKSTRDRIFMVNDTPMTIMPNEVHAYTVEAVPQLSFAILDLARKPVRVVTFIVQ